MRLVVRGGGEGIVAEGEAAQQRVGHVRRPEGRHLPLGRPTPHCDAAVFSRGSEHRLGGVELERIDPPRVRRDEAAEVAAVRAHLEEADVPGGVGGEESRVAQPHEVHVAPSSLGKSPRRSHASSLSRNTPTPPLASATATSAPSLRASALVVRLRPPLLLALEHAHRP
eukprot:CAMPEP_0182804772 /NCGR_PEP_ID=MMETSP0006_2-20121128/4725_1 /TAXON_ID=97485 /ORGANISM="Prymnesium parvum, Strain Texoma1" /LENGTH=168 /DNA_ID=CAMNT_0024930305 /DNA_START=246 /DNA_END=749 /DNA_ORIENTATION=-